MKELLFAIFILLPLALVRIVLYGVMIAIWIIGSTIVFWSYQVDVGVGFALTILWLIISAIVWGKRK